MQGSGVKSSEIGSYMEKILALASGARRDLLLLNFKSNLQFRIIRYIIPYFAVPTSNYLATITRLSLVTVGSRYHLWQ
jgi:hypothetical protein